MCCYLLVSQTCLTFWSPGLRIRVLVDVLLPVGISDMFDILISWIADWSFGRCAATRCYLGHVLHSDLLYWGLEFWSICCYLLVSRTCLTFISPGLGIRVLVDVLLPVGIGHIWHSDLLDWGLEFWSMCCYPLVSRTCLTFWSPGLGIRVLVDVLLPVGISDMFDILISCIED